MHQKLLPKVLFRNLGFRAIRWCSGIMESYETCITPPEAVRGCTKLDKAAFNTEFEFHGVKITDTKRCSTFLSRLAHARVKCPYVKGVLPVHCSNDSSKVKELHIMLGPAQIVGKLLTDDDHDWIAANEGVEFMHRVPLGYDDFTRKDILKAVLPTDLDIASSFEMAGHIAHYNLKKRHLPFKDIIGQVTLDKSKDIRTVVNKVEELGSGSAFRFFKMELIAGEANYVTNLRENQCSFTLDYSKVYWNSRLRKEHEDLVCLFKPGQVVLDVFAGVGPFAIPAAKLRRCTVHANDLNPHSYTYLLKNIEDNNVSGKVKAYNLDGKKFIAQVSRNLVDESLSGFSSEGLEPYSHAVMNLPGDATSFLTAFRGVFCGIPEDFRQHVTMPVIHCHCFVEEKNEDEIEEISLEKVKNHLGLKELEEGSYSVVRVRSVSSVSLMMRVSFRLPSAVAFSDDSLKMSASGEKIQNDQHTCNIDNSPEEIFAKDVHEVKSEVTSGTVSDTLEHNKPESKRLKLEQ